MQNADIIRISGGGRRNSKLLTRKLGFTLAELLITVGIIGVVAAMTLPAIIQNNQHKELEARFKKSYSILWNIHLRMVNDYNGVYSNFILKDLAGSSGDTDLNQKKEEYINAFSKYLNGPRICQYSNAYVSCSGKSLPAVYKTYTGNKNAHLGGDTVTNKAILTADGMSFFFGNVTWRNARIYIDTNGTAKGPNRLGFDLFAFDIDKNDKIIEPKNIGGGSSGGNEEGTVDAVNLCSAQKFGNVYNGFGCSIYALRDASPDVKGGKYWKNLPK